MKPEPTEQELIARAKAKAEAVFQRCAPEPVRIASTKPGDRRAVVRG